MTADAATPRTCSECPIAVTWPTIAAYPLGRLVGQLSGLRIGWGFFTVGKLLALATIPLTLVIFGWKFLPVVCRRYALTTRRIVIRRGLKGADGPSIRLDEFDAIDVIVLPGQAWLRSGEIVCRRDGTEVFRLSGVTCPEVFRQMCLKARHSLLAVERVIHEQAVTAGA